MTPQQKKQLSYERDCRNCYGENSKASRKHIALRRAIKHRRYRHAVKQCLVTAANLELADIAVKSIRQESWQKVSDIPLKEHLEHRLSRRIRTGQLPERPVNAEG